MKRITNEDCENGVYAKDIKSDCSLEIERGVVFTGKNIEVEGNLYINNYICCENIIVSGDITFEGRVFVENKINAKNIKSEYDIICKIVECDNLYAKNIRCDSIKASNAVCIDYDLFSKNEIIANSINATYIVSLKIESSNSIVAKGKITAGNYTFAKKGNIKAGGNIYSGENIECANIEANSIESIKSTFAKNNINVKKDIKCKSLMSGGYITVGENVYSEFEIFAENDIRIKNIECYNISCKKVFCEKLNFNGNVKAEIINIKNTKSKNIAKIIGAFSRIFVLDNHYIIEDNTYLKNELQKIKKDYKDCYEILKLIQN